MSAQKCSDTLVFLGWCSVGENYKDMRMFVNIVSLLKQIGIEDGTGKEDLRPSDLLSKLDYSGEDLIR